MRRSMTESGSLLCIPYASSAACELRGVARGQRKPYIEAVARGMQYGHTTCAACISSVAVAASTPGRLMVSSTSSPKPCPSSRLPMPTAAVTVDSGETVTLRWLATNLSAPRKQAEYPAAKSCSGLLPSPRVRRVRVALPGQH